MKKRTVAILSVVIFVLLLGCTVYSAFHYDRSLPIVTALAPERGTVNGEEYAMLVPADCVYQDNEGVFVYRLKQTEDGWKTERCTVSIEASDGTHTAIRRIVSEEILVAAFPSAPLSDGQIVKLINEATSS